MTSDLAQLKARVLFAHRSRFKVAYAADYVADLGGGAPPPGVEVNSTAHLLHLIELAEKKAAAPVAAPAPVAPVVKPEPVAVVEAPAPVEAAPVVEEAPAAVEEAPATVEETVEADAPAEASDAKASSKKHKKK